MSETNAEKDESGLTQLLCAELVALHLYPVDWFCSDNNEFKTDQNAGKRAVAVDVAKYFIGVREAVADNGMLSEEELRKCCDLYEKETGKYWIPVAVEDQALWIAAFEQAKIYFKS
jgi:hypothetical protein